MTEQPAKIDVCALDSFTTAYLECVLWQAGEICDENGDTTGECYDDKFDICDIAQESLRDHVETCAEFQKEHGHLWGDYSDEKAGRDFALTRNGHGTGFWDRGLEHGKALSDHCKPYGTYYVYEGDDGCLYVS